MFSCSAISTCSVLDAQGRVAASMRALEPEGGASGAGEAICRHVCGLHVGASPL